MRLFIIGATGRTGRALVDQARARGHSVTAFVRAPEKLAELRDRVVIQRGDPRSVADLQAALPGHDAVVSALGPPGLGESTILRDAARATVQAMQAVGVRRLLIVSAGMLFDDTGTVAVMLRRTVLCNIAKDSAEMERMVTSSGLEWTIARPPRLTNGPLNGHYVAVNGRMPPDSRLSTSRADVANFLLDEAERPEHVRHVVGVSTRRGRGRAIAYWVITVILATECLVGGVLGAIGWAPYREIMRHLGYPGYLMIILGLWYALAGVALLVPRFPRLKEWAYAGLIFNYTGAAASHLAVGDGAGALAAPIVFTGLTVASWALRPVDRRELTAHERSRAYGIRTIAYWLFTVLLAFEMVAGGIWDLLRIEYVRAVLQHLGYPMYLLFIIGAWKIPCAAVMLVPRFPRLKEWAYAGAIFNYTGAVASHFAVGDGANGWGGPLLLATFTLASWISCPSARRLAPTSPAVTSGVVE